MMFDYSEAKSQMVASRYRAEQNMTRIAGIMSCKKTNTVVECFAGMGGLTEVYKEHFKDIINNDLNPDSVAQYNLKAIDFVKDVVSKVNKKIDLIDFDCYGCPAFEIQEFFKFANKHIPFVLCLSDGFGAWMKRSKKEGPIRSRYLMEGPIDHYRIWDRHEQLIDQFLTTLAFYYKLKATKICSVQTKSKNYVLATYGIDEYK